MDGEGPPHFYSAKAEDAPEAGKQAGGRKRSNKRFARGQRRFVLCCFCCLFRLTVLLLGLLQTGARDLQYNVMA